MSDVVLFSFAPRLSFSLKNWEHSKMSRFRTPTHWFLPEVVQMAQWLAATHGYSGVAMWRSILSWKRTRSLPEIYPLKMAIPMGSDIWLLSYHVLWVSKQHGDVMDNWCLTTVIILLCLYWDYYQQGIPSNKPIRWQRCSSRKTLTMRVRFHKKSDGSWVDENHVTCGRLVQMFGFQQCWCRSDITW